MRTDKNDVWWILGLRAGQERAVVLKRTPGPLESAVPIDKGQMGPLADVQFLRAVFCPSSSACRFLVLFLRRPCPCPARGVSLGSLRIGRLRADLLIPILDLLFTPLLCQSYACLSGVKHTMVGTVAMVKRSSTDGCHEGTGCTKVHPVQTPNARRTLPPRGLKGPNSYIPN